VILNGLNSIANYTFKRDSENPKNAGKSVIDFICVPYKIYEKVSFQTHIDDELKLSDHRLISVTFTDVSLNEVNPNSIKSTPKSRINWNSYLTYAEQNLLIWFQNDNLLNWRI